MSREDLDEPRLPEGVWALLREDQASEAAIEQAFVRFKTPKRATRAPLGLGRWLAAGLVLGWGVVYAATGEPLPGFHFNATDVSPRRAPRSVPDMHARKPRELPQPRESVSQPNEAVPQQGERLSEPGDGVPPPHGSDSQPSNHVAQPSPAPALTAAPRVDPKWDSVARALRNHDFVAAETGLRALETAGSPADREAAKLSLAQVLLARGRVTEARARLEQLRTFARSPLVRAKATTLLESELP